MHNLSDILAGLYASEINCSILWLWDGGFDVKLGDEMNGWNAETTVTTTGSGVEAANVALARAATWLVAQALYHYPQSAFARHHTEASRG